MNASEPRDPWSRLTASARRAPSDPRDVSAPFGFSTRVAALAFTVERPVVSLFERFSLRALGVASLLALLSVAANYSIFTNASSDDDLTIMGEDPVAVLLETS